MNRERQLLDLLQREVVPAQGCTEPIALAFCAAKVTQVLGNIPDKVVIYASGNIIKNVKSVTVPNSGGMIGIEPAVAMGLVVGNPDKELMVIADVTTLELEGVKRYLMKEPIEIYTSDKKIRLYIQIVGYHGEDKAIVEIKYAHNNITLVQKNEEVLYKVDDNLNKENLVDEVIKTFSVKEIFEIAVKLDVSSVKPLFDLIVKNNTKISQEGLNNSYGAQTGRNIRSAIDLGFYGDDVRNNAAAAAAAGSDARMGGSALPVMTVAGSGNIGITISMALIKFAEFNKKGSKELYRAIFLASLITVYIKSRIGRLSALCGPTCASAGIAAGLALMLEQPLEKVNKAIINALASIVGIMCDGANSSCSMKIANSIYTAYDAVNAAMLGNSVTTYDGIVGKDVEETIENVVYIATDEGMSKTDLNILNIMTKHR
ncbi:L-serine ammonia-lyase, iron-sulfur-dependent, subunit alpha [Francisella sp. 19X1-34]|uniref:L-cysteine desulfidase family protein n=1 Tax=Francisella sp. 19X1-34 TaxID=3087177 RepID=UPI002E33F3DD|nr:L-serine ammonia-lyase, iron-sulfur-dependent, subunit alpha [Francisella sp. 19X1-34]MED7788317.1 L-serine ammonia-lyase, iron-sulfur-dependent, subunit alpha [Francisella sp. 19X1-34]